MPVLIIVVGVLLLGGGGISFSAENSLPGDVLYPVKVNANEEVRLLLSFSEEAKAEWEIQRAERRMLEAEELAAEGKLTAEAAADLQARFEEHAKVAQGFAAKAEQNQKARVASGIRTDLEGLLSVHEQILLQIEENTEAEMSARLADLRAALVSHMEAVAQARVQAESEIASRPDEESKDEAEEEKEVAENKIVEVRAFLENQKVQEEAKADAEARLQSAIRLTAEGNAQLTQESYTKALLKFQAALKAAQQAKTIVSAKAALPVSVEVQIEEETQTETGTQQEGGVETEGEVRGETEVEAEVNGETEIKTNTETEERLYIDL